MGFCVTLSEAEIPAEAGLCVVIPCSLTTDFGFKPKNMIWYKCEPDKQKCGDSDMIFHTSKKVQSGFNGRVSLLDPDLDQGNCSIIICDLVDSDSGSYQFGVGRFPFGKPKITFSPRTTVSVKGMKTRQNRQKEDVDLCNCNLVVITVKRQYKYVAVVSVLHSEVVENE